jgi:hypothetical protein
MSYLRLIRFKALCRRPGLEPGPITTSVSRCAKAVQQHLSPQATRRMGPGFRRGDDWGLVACDERNAFAQETPRCGIALAYSTRHASAPRASEISRAGRDNPTRRANHLLIFRTVGQAPLAKIFRFSESTNQSIRKGIPPGERGVSRSSRTRAGMRWTRRRRMTSAGVADGKAVWSWHPDAGVKFAESKTSRGRRWQESPVTGESPV